MKNLLLLSVACAFGLAANAQTVTAKWELSDTADLAKATVEGTPAALVSTSFTVGDKIAKWRPITNSNASSGYEAVTYTPPFTAFSVATKTSSKTTGHCVAFTITPETGHTFMPTALSFDAMKVGTDGGAFGVYYSVGAGSDVTISSSVGPNRNRVDGANPDAYSHHEFTIVNASNLSEPVTVWIYLMNINGVDNSSPKELGLRNIVFSGVVDDGPAVASKYIKSFTFTGAETPGETRQLDMFNLIANVRNGETVTYPTKLYGGAPSDFNIETNEGYVAETTYAGENNTLTVSIYEGEGKLMTFNVRFKVSNRGPKPAAKPLNRGLMSLNLEGSKAEVGGVSLSGNLISWRHREADGYGVKYKLWRGTTADEQAVCLNGKKYITDRTNFHDQSGRTDHWYKLEVYNEYGELLATEEPVSTWADQNFRIPLERPAPRGGAFYCPNDASYCDMDGDGEYEIILKWSPSNEKDAASSGSTSPIYLDCIKLDGTRLWRIDAGPNFFTSAHTMQFIAWDFDGDGYGELMMKTAPGTIDGEGNYVLLGDDDPNENLLSGRGKQDHGSEYITVFDGLTGGELATIPYHTDYAAGQSYWGDSNQNRSERYLAALAYLDGPDKNPCPIFARGYYSGAFVGAYDWDGVTLKERWVSRNTESGKGLWGEGAHWISVGDCDEDGFQEIIYGSAALDHDGSLLYRTGLGHGDALHLGDFLPDRPGMEVFMVHEHKPYGYDLRDAKTGEFILRETAGSDTGRGLAAHFDNKSDHSQFIYSASASMHDCLDGSVIGETWAIGSSGAGINNRIYWDGDLYDEFYDKSIIANWNHDGQYFDRYKVNGTWYTSGTLNNSSKFNPCVLGDFLGDWREEIINWEGDKETGEGDCNLVINATNYTSDYRLPHLMDDLNYRVQVVNQNCCYNQPPHLSFDPSRKYAGNPNQAQQEDIGSEGISGITIDSRDGQNEIYTLQGIRLDRISSPGLYIVNGEKVVVK